MDILIIAGHGAGDSGAVGCGYEEATLARKAANILEGKLNAYDCKVARYPAARNAYEDNKAGMMAKSFGDFDLVIEIHFNSFNTRAHGCEVLYRPPNMRNIAAHVSAAIASHGFTNRGAKQRTDLKNMNTCERAGVPYILIETAFIDNRGDMMMYAKDLYSVWDEVADALARYYGLKKLASAGEPVETSKTTKTAKKPPKSTKKGYGGAFPSLPKKGYLGRGDKGEQIKRLQRFLNWYGNYKLDIDGSLGALTESAIKKFQKDTKIEIDGYFGKESLKAAKAAKK